MTQQAVLNQQRLDDYGADDRLARAAVRRAVAMLLEAGILEWHPVTPQTKEPA